MKLILSYNKNNTAVQNHDFHKGKLNENPFSSGTRSTDTDPTYIWIICSNKTFQAHMKNVVESTYTLIKNS